MTTVRKKARARAEHTLRSLETGPDGASLTAAFPLPETIVVRAPSSYSGNRTRIVSCEPEPAPRTSDRESI
jgi:hypothetical protein